MIVAKKWVAAGSTATLLAGGLFLGAPMASAAPGDAACLQASVQFNAALSAAGIDVAFVNQLEVATAAVVTAAENLAAVSVSLNVDALAADEARTAQAAIEAQLVVEEAKLAVADALAASDPAAFPDPEADPVVVAARAAEADASALETAAVAAAVVAADASAAVLVDPTLVAAQTDLETVSAQADTLLQQLSGDEALAAELVALFKAFLAACNASAIGVDTVTPVVVAAPVAPVTTVAPAAGVPAPTGTNKGLNVQTAVATEDSSAAVALIAALLAVGVAVPLATAARMRRLERAQR